MSEKIFKDDKKLLKKMSRFCLLCCFVYFSSYITRKSYNASIKAIIDDASLGFNSVDTGLAVTGSFITYGIGQIINGFLGDKIRARKMITIGLIGASLCNIIIPFWLSPTGFCILWSFNGFFQSMIWPPLVRSMSENFTLEFYKKGSTLVSVACSIATIGIYLLVAFFVEFFKWQYTFYFCAAIGILSAVMWYTVYGKYEHHPIVDRHEDSSSPNSEPAAEKLPFFKVVMISSAVPIALAVAFQGFLRDGIETWMSTFLADNYNINTSGAILTVAILPILSILSYSVGSYFQRKTGCPLTSSLIIWGFAIVFSAALLLFYQSSAVIGVIGIAVLSGASHAINLMLTNRINIYYKKVGYVSTFSGLLNSFTYIGAALATYGIAEITSEQPVNWKPVMLIFLAVSVCGFILNLIAIPRWKKFMKD